MKTHIVLTPANIEIEYRLAGAGSRLAAFVIDFLIQLSLGAIITIFTLLAVFGRSFEAIANVSGFVLGFLIITWFVIYFCYFIVLEMLMNGQSIGKKLFGLRVICDNGQPVGLLQSMIRNFFKALFDIFYAGIFVILFSKKHKRVGDMVAGTIVIAEHYGHTGAPLRPSIQTNIKENYEVANLPDEFAEINLNEDEKELLYAYLARKNQLEINNIHKKIQDYFYEKWQIDSSLINDEFLTTLLKKSEQFRE